MTTSNTLWPTSKAHVAQPLPPNTRLQLTPLRVERDRRFFESLIRLDSHSDLEVRRN